jgi:hypothetical protein
LLAAALETDVVLARIERVEGRCGCCAPGCRPASGSKIRATETLSDETGVQRLNPVLSSQS